LREVLKLRAKQIGLEVIKLMDDLPNKPSVWVLTKQIIRSSTSIGANYRAAFRAKSDADFVYKLKIVEEETDETIYWLEVLEESKLVDNQKIQLLKQECEEILSIVVATIKTKRLNINNKQ
jgi:four helix bundle protein